MGKIAVYAGSFDPFTNGHLSIVKEASNIFDSVCICIAKNSEKNRFVDVDKMAKAIDACLKREGLRNCVVYTHEGMIADFCKEHNVDYLVRGLRNTSDYLYEENIAKINYELNPYLKNVYFRATNETISSSMIREFLKYGKSVDKYVPEEILDVLNILK